MSGAFSYAFGEAFDSPTATAPIVIGPIADRRDVIIDRVRQNLHGHVDDEWIGSAVDSAIGYVIIWTGRMEIGLPADELIVNGLVVFATRIYMDAFSPSGAQVAIADATFEPLFQPEDLYKHVHHYFDHLTVSWGVG